MSGCYINSIPSGISKLSLLEDLNLSSNFIQNIPNDIGCLPSLFYIDLSDNLIEELPKPFFNLNKAIDDRYLIIDLSGNLLKNCDKRWGQMTRCREIDLSHNHISQFLPNLFINLTRLISLKLSFNNAKKINLDYTKYLPYLRFLHAEGNQYHSHFQCFLQNPIISPSSSSSSLKSKIHSPSFSSSKKNNILSLKNINNRSLLNTNKYLMNKSLKNNNNNHNHGNNNNNNNNNKHNHGNNNNNNNKNNNNFTSNNLNFDKNNHKNQKNKCTKKNLTPHFTEILANYGNYSKKVRPILINQNRFIIGYSETIGNRDQMEDAIDIKMSQNISSKSKDINFFALYDGHGGRRAVNFVSSEMSELFLKILNDNHKLNNSNNSIFNQNILSEKTTRINKKKTNHQQPQRKPIKNNHLNQRGNDFFKNNNQNYNYYKIFQNNQIINTLKMAFNQINNKLLKRQEISGTTAVMTIIYGERLYCLNIGDSRAIVSKNGKAIRLSYDHKPSLEEEKERIQKKGGNVTQDYRINRSLAVSRSFGDFHYSQFLSCEPHVKTLKLTPEHEFLILACDGVFDVLEDQDVIDIAMKCETPYQAAIRIRNCAKSFGSNDNISVIVINLQPKSSKGKKSNHRIDDRSKIINYTNKKYVTSLLNEIIPNSKQNYFITDNEHLLNVSKKGKFPKKSDNGETTLKLSSDSGWFTYQPENLNKVLNYFDKQKFSKANNNNSNKKKKKKNLKFKILKKNNHNDKNENIVGWENHLSQNNKTIKQVIHNRPISNHHLMKKTDWLEFKTENNHNIKKDNHNNTKINTNNGVESETGSESYNDDFNWNGKKNEKLNEKFILNNHF
ncbi:phosphatase 2c [Anaeramoeba flamelloides]|uniref:protein-serine/threonine phosphatase n=1 Tax=Anaeramoeba flamelloides TaxID=1746091 RepID=A0AAV7Z5K9_9EUKA|nr:phosphatase 2c [Anaeramoeba flamelloides]